jgi:hypothetical protein
MEREPQELLPAMPPIVPRLPVEMSTGNHRPLARSCAFSASSVMPGSTQQVRCSALTERTRRRCFEVSMTRQRPTVWPHCEVPPPRGSTGTPSSRAIAIAAKMSSTCAGTTTPSGSIW